jgi:hypothetical protein
MRNAECRIAEIVGGLVGVVLIVGLGLAEMSFPLTPSFVKSTMEGRPALFLAEREDVWLCSVLVMSSGGFKAFGLIGGDRGRGRRGRDESEEVGGVVLEEPVAEAALFPFGEVLFVDGAAVEFSGEDGFSFRQGVEPGEDGFVRLVVVKTEVELFADGVREASDFADTSGSVHNIYDL